MIRINGTIPARVTFEKVGSERVVLDDGLWRLFFVLVDNAST